MQEKRHCVIDKLMNFFTLIAEKNKKVILTNFCKVISFESDVKLTLNLTCRVENSIRLLICTYRFLQKFIKKILQIIRGNRVIIY